MGLAVEISVEPFVDCKGTTWGMNDVEFGYVKWKDLIPVG